MKRLTEKHISKTLTFRKKISKRLGRKAFEDWPIYPGELRFHNEEAMFEYFHPRQKLLADLWRKGKLEEAEELGEKMIRQGFKYPTVFTILALIYRKQKRYLKEAEVLKKGMQAQIDMGNSKSVYRDFERRLRKITRFQADLD